MGNFAADLSLRIRAGFSGIWVHTQEPEEAIRQIAAVFKQNGWTLAVWDIVQGIRGQGTNDGPPNPITSLTKLPQLSDGNNPCALAMMNFHLFLRGGRPDMIQATANAINEGRRFSRFVIALSNECTIPAELERLFVVVEHALPDADELLQIATETVAEGEIPKDADDKKRIMEASAGLTRMEAEGSFALSVIGPERKLTARTIWEYKSQALKKTGFLTLYRHDPANTYDLEPSFKTIGGYNSIKKYTVSSINSTSVVPKGIMLVGVPGTGKSLISKALGREVGWPTVILDLGALFGGIVGQTESNIRRALDLIDMMAPCILFVDELEKGMAGGGSSASDGGVAQRMLGILLTWLNDHTSKVYFIGTTNDMTKLSSMSAGAFTRAGRFDATFFMDTPNRIEKDAIWEIFEKLYGVSGERPNDLEWTGAEIKTCCAQAKMLGISLMEAQDYFVPVYKSAPEQIQALRDFSSCRCLSASYPGVYVRDKENKIKSGDGARRVLAR